MACAQSNERLTRLAVLARVWGQQAASDALENRWTYFWNQSAPDSCRRTRIGRPAESSPPRSDLQSPAPRSSTNDREPQLLVAPPFLAVISSHCFGFRVRIGEISGPMAPGDLVPRVRDVETRLNSGNAASQGIRIDRTNRKDETPAARKFDLKGPTNRRFYAPGAKVEDLTKQA